MFNYPYKLLFEIPLVSGISASILNPAMIIILLFSSSIDFFELTSLSKLGESGVETAIFFNSSLIIGGILLIIFATGLKKNSFLIGNLGLGVFVFAAFSLISVGILHIPHSFHNLSAVLFFVALPTSLLLMGQRIIRSSRGHHHLRSLNKIGFGTLGLGITMWSLNVLMIIFFSTINIIIFELIIIFISSIWLLLFGRKLLHKF